MSAMLAGRTVPGHISTLDRTYLFPRVQEEHYGDEPLLTTEDTVLARAIELAYDADDLEKELAALAERARDHGLDVSTRDLESYLEAELGGRIPSYSGVITDSLVHLESLNQCFSWTTEELEDQLSNIVISLEDAPVLTYLRYPSTRHQYGVLSD